MNTTFALSLASLAFGILFFVLTVLLLGTPPLDIGMVSTAAVFVLLGVFGLLLGRAQEPPANA